MAVRCAWKFTNGKLAGRVEGENYYKMYERLIDGEGYGMLYGENALLGNV